MELESHHQTTRPVSLAITQTAAVANTNNSPLLWQSTPPESSSRHSVNIHDDAAWVAWAVAQLNAEAQRSGETHMVAVPIQRFANAGIDLYFKDESTHPTGSLKHRLARSLISYALCNGLLKKGQVIVEASSGSTAVSEAYFARQLGLPFVAVMPKSTSPEKIALIEFYGASCVFVERAADVYETAHNLAKQRGGYYVDQFTNAERATDWRGGNVAESMFTQMRCERHPVPSWMVVGAGTGGTSATIGRYIRFHGYSTQLCVADPTGSVFMQYWQDGDSSRTSSGSRIEGIGRPRVEPSFLASVVDHMIEVQDTQSIAAMHALSNVLSRKVGPSTGTNFFAMVQLAESMRLRGETGSLVSMICDAGERYLPTYFNPDWVASRMGHCEVTVNHLKALLCD